MSNVVEFKKKEKEPVIHSRIGVPVTREDGMSAGEVFKLLQMVPQKDTLRVLQSVGTDTDDDGTPLAVFLVEGYEGTTYLLVHEGKVLTLVRPERK